MADVKELLDYYKNLLIIQYNNKPKARATIEALSKILLAEGILFDIRDGFNIDTAVGVQLDIIGKYVGLDRYYTVINPPIDYFALTDYAEIDPDSGDKFGFTDYANFEDFQYNGTLNYNSVLTVDNKLNDHDFRTLIKLKIIQNNSNHSHKSIDDAMWNIFADSIIPSSDGDMHMFYFIKNDESSIIQAALAKGVIPRPMGVGVSLIKITDKVMGYITYDDLDHDFQNSIVAGFTDFDNYENETNGMLTYDDIS